MSLFRYHLRLAAKSLQRNPVISAIMLIALALGNGTWSVAVSQYTRFQAYGVSLSPTLHQVEMLHPPDALSVFQQGAPVNPYLEPTSILIRTQLSYPDAQRLMTSGVPAQQSAGIRSEVLVRRDDRHASLRVARFTNASFFTMFNRTMAAGQPWSAAEDAGATGVVVLGRDLGQRLFPGGGALGQSITVEGRPHRVVGVLSDYQPLNAPWQLLMIGGFEDALFLPWGDWTRLRAFPDQPIYRSPVGPGFDAVRASDALYVNLWLDLPTAQQRADYRAYLDRVLGPGRYALRSLAAWHQDLPMPRSQIAFFVFLGLVVLVAGGFNLSRWLLTRGLSRGAELGVFRALGAPRSSLFWRIVAEGALLALPAALLAPLAAAPTVWIFNRYVRVVDMPLEVGWPAIVLSVGAPLLVCALGAVYPAWRLARTPPTLYLGKL